MAIRALAFVLLACVGVAPAGARALDQSRVHGYYHDGEFDKVIKELEAYQKAGPCARAESLFIEKHLAVVYAANPSTRELGRYHMYRMLDLQPDVDLLDMFVGEEVDGVFDKVRKEHVLRSGSAHAPAPAAGTTTAPLPPKSSSAYTAPQPPKPVAPTYAPQPIRPPVAAAPASRPPLSIAARPASQPRPAQYPPARPRLRPVPAATNATTAKAGPAAPENPVAKEAAGPAWKEPGLWVGGGAALAVVAITLFYSGDKAQPTPSKVYVVPATASK